MSRPSLLQDESMSADTYLTHDSPVQISEQSYFISLIVEFIVSPQGTF